MIILPDTHGRDFWREPVREALKYNDHEDSVRI